MYWKKIDKNIWYNLIIISDSRKVKKGDDIFMKNAYIVDREEDKYYVLESPNGDMINVLKSSIESSIKSGDVLYKKDNKYYYSEEMTQKRKNDIKELMKGIWVE